LLLCAVLAGTFVLVPSVDAAAVAAIRTDDIVAAIIVIIC
jgi:hypothetical protein